jgi:hypothetical protein
MSRKRARVGDSRPAMRGAHGALRSIGQKNLTSPRIPRTAHVRAHALLEVSVLESSLLPRGSATAPVTPAICRRRASCGQFRRAAAARYLLRSPRAAVPAPVQARSRHWRKQGASAGPVSRSAGGFDREPRLRRPDAPSRPTTPTTRSGADRRLTRVHRARRGRFPEREPG